MGQKRRSDIFIVSAREELTGFKLPSKGMSDFRLVYFSLRGRAEPIRWILAVAKQQYNDERIDKEKEWPLRKKEFPYEKVPIMFIDGKPLCQSVTICRHLGHLFKMSTENPWMTAVGDEVVDAVHDLIPAVAKVLYARQAGDHEEAEVLRKEFNAGVLKTTLHELEAKLQDRTWFCGEKMTWVDIFVACYLSQLFFKNEEGFVNAPKVKNHFERVLAIPEIQKWIKERPSTLL